MKSRKLSTIEMSVLGVAWLRGPCTTYVVMKELATSESTFYRSRAGTAYSVVDRLLRAGFLESGPSLENDERRIQVSAQGIEQLRHWLLPPIPAPDIAHTADLVRLRFFFLSALTSEERIRFVDDAIKGMKEHLLRCESLVEESKRSDDRFGQLAALALVMETNARIAWLLIVRDQVA